MGIQVIHSCATITGTTASAIVNRCAGCRACDEHRRTHDVPTSGGMVQVVRCSHCDGHDAHTSIRPNRKIQ
jgi:hypothetical protein